MTALASPTIDTAGELRLQLAAFPRLTDTRPRPVSLLWPEVARRLTAFEVRTEKDGAGYSPAIYRQGATRSNDAVEALTAAVLDVDHDTPAWDLLEGLEYVAHTTFSHTPDGPHWRIVLPFMRPVSAEAWPGVWERIKHRLCPNADDACKDVARFYWKPAHRPGAAHDTRIGIGSVLDPDQLPALPPTLPPARTQAIASHGGRPGDEYAAATEWLAILEPRGWRRVYERGEEEVWRRPGKRDGASATVNYEGSGLLYVFSSNAAPFASNTTYTKFGAYALLEHDGDYTAATKTLVALGYGTPAAAKNVTPSAPPKNGNGSQGHSSLGNGSLGPKNTTKAVFPPGEILSANVATDGAVSWPRLGCRLGSDVVPTNVEWLWEDRLALGKLNLIEGDGVEGKSMILDDLAARLSANLPLPDGSPNPFGEPVKVLLLMAEDDAADTIIPRIIAAGGNPANIILLDSIPDESGGHFPTIPDDLDHIERVVATANARAAFIDPFVSYLSEEVNSHNDHSVRRALADLPGLAARNRCAVAAVRHLNKNTAADPKHRGSGAGAFINLARVSLAIGPDPNDSAGERRVLAVNKVNVGEQAGALAYHIETAWVRKGKDDDELVKTARVVWDGPSTLTAADILGAKPDEETRNAGDVARDLLTQLLSSVPQDEELVWGAVKKAGISHSTYMRARSALRVKASRVGGIAAEGKWQVALAAPPKNVSEGQDSLSDILTPSASLPDRKQTSDGVTKNLTNSTRERPVACEQSDCTRPANAMDRGRWFCYGHHPLGTAAKAEVLA